LHAFEGLSELEGDGRADVAEFGDVVDAAATDASEFGEDGEGYLAIRAVSQAADFAGNFFGGHVCLSAGPR
jgi:hypothetical protein